MWFSLEKTRDVLVYSLLRSICFQSQESIRSPSAIEGFFRLDRAFRLDEESSSPSSLLAGVLVEFADGPFGSQACQPFLPKVRIKILVICKVVMADWMEASH